MNQAQSAQRLDEMQLSRIKIVKIFVARQHIRQLPHLICAFPGEQHPQILNGRTHASIIKINKAWPTVLNPQDIARVTVAVQS